MHKSEYKNIFQLEESHFYYLATHELIIGLVQKYCSIAVKVLDAGCGTGGLMTKLISSGRDVVGVDKSDEAIRYCLKRRLSVKAASVDKLPFKNGAFDLVVSVDVLYHLWVKQVNMTIQEFSRVLRPKGWLVVKVPAHNWIRTDHDKLVMTGRRFSISEVRQMMLEGGFEVSFLSYAHLPLLLISVLKTWLDKGEEKSGVMPINPVINRLLLGYLKLENWWLLKGWSIPWGNCIVVVARKG